MFNIKDEILLRKVDCNDLKYISILIIFSHLLNWIKYFIHWPNIETNYFIFFGSIEWCRVRLHKLLDNTFEWNSDRVAFHLRTQYENLMQSLIYRNVPQVALWHGIWKLSHSCHAVHFDVTFILSHLCHALRRVSFVALEFVGPHMDV